jgi:hypothetical protein
MTHWPKKRGAVIEPKDLKFRQPIVNQIHSMDRRVSLRYCTLCNCMCNVSGYVPCLNIQRYRREAGSKCFFFLYLLSFESGHTATNIIQRRNAESEAPTCLKLECRLFSCSLGYMVPRKHSIFHQIMSIRYTDESAVAMTVCSTTDTRLNCLGIGR